MDAQFAATRSSSPMNRQERKWRKPRQERDISRRRGPAVPYSLPELKQDDDGKYNRPEFLNYHFAEIDLLDGPVESESVSLTSFLWKRATPKTSTLAL